MPTMLNGKRVLVAGGTGDVGAGIVEVLLAHGAHVIVPARSPEKAKRLVDDLPSPDGLVVIPGDIGTTSGAAAVAAAVRNIGPLDGVVASLGGWWQGKTLVDVDAAEWDALIANNFTSHFAVAANFLPMLTSPGSSYVQILGAAAEFPIPGSSLVSITAAGVAMLGRVLALESADSAVRVRQIMIASIVATRSRATVDPAWVTATQVGEQVARMIAAPGEGDDVVRITG